MKSETVKMERKRHINIEVSKEAIKCTFLNAIQEVESLREFYKTYHASWIKNKYVFEQNNEIGLAVNSIIEKILDNETPEIYYEQIKETQIGDQKFSDIIDLYITQNEQQTSISYSMRQGFSQQDPQKSRTEIYKFDSQREIFVRSILSNIVIIFEGYLAQIYEFMVVLNPESYFEGKTVKTKDLFSGSVEKIISNEVHKQVSDNMYDSLKTLEVMKEKSSFNINRYISIQEEFEEIYYRRNIFVHNFGIVNEIYLSNIADKYKSKIKCNEKISCDDEYIENAIDVLKKIICVLFYEFLLVTNSDNSCYDILSHNIAFTALSNEEYSVSEYIYGILRKHKEFEFADRTMFEVNYMIALKQQKKSIDNLLEKFDVSAMQEQFVIAKNCLLGNNEEVYSQLSKTNYMPAEAIRDWPLFIDFRKSEQYDRYKAEHADDFKHYTFEATEDQTICETTDIICNEDSIQEAIGNSNHAASTGVTLRGREVKAPPLPTRRLLR